MTTSATAAPSMDRRGSAAPARTAAPVAPATPAVVEDSAPDRLLDRADLPAVVGVVARVTLAAFENRALMPILPAVVRDLAGWALFGASAGATLETFTVATG